MPKRSISSLTDEEVLKLVERRVEEEPELFVAKLAEALSERLDEKFGWRQGELADGFESLERKLNTLDQKFDRMGNRLDRLEGNLQTFYERQEVEAQKIEKRVVEAIDERFTRLETRLSTVIGDRLGGGTERRPA